MVSSMNRIKDSNDAVMAQVSDGNKKISEIVNVINEIGNKTKVINDIVFQTKLLSFNASVEAARAGEHGKGFAVVAEEVGNLAAMSGNAAKEISTLLDQSIQQVQTIVADTQNKIETLFEGSKTRLQEGTNIAHECEQGLSEIRQSVSTAETLSKKIAQAALEQNKGVEQINVALTQLEQLTQTNSQAADQTSGLSQDLSAQAGALKEAVQRLGTIIGEVSYHHPQSSAAPTPINFDRVAKRAGTEAA